MSTATFDTVTFPFVIGAEGKFDNDPRDRGNWTDGAFGKKGGVLKGTKYGVASHAYPDLDIKNLTIDDARAIMKRDYAAKVAYDQLPPGVDVSAFDMAYNAGPVRSLKLLQASLGATTSAAASLAQLAALAVDKITLIKTFAAKRLGFYRALNNPTYIRGWTRRAAECEALSVKTWLKFGAQKTPAEIKAALGKESGQASTQSKKEATKAAAAPAAPAATQAPDTPAHVDVSGMPWWVVALIVLAVVGVTAFFVYRVYVHRTRAAAYAAVAEGS